MNAKKGFTLIEVIVYTAILAIVLGFSLLALFELRDSASANRSRTAVSSEGNFVMQKISWALAGATVISDPAIGATSSRLSVDKYGFAGNPVVIEADDGAVFLSRGSADPLPLTTGNVSVDSLVFTHGDEVLSAPEFVRIHLTLSASSTAAGHIASTTLRTTIYLRK